jgi:hypothetical protein
MLNHVLFILYFSLTIFVQIMKHQFKKSIIFYCDIGDKKSRSSDACVDVPVLGTSLSYMVFVSLLGFWRVLDFDFLTLVLNHITQLCEENDWLSAGIPLDECCNTLQELFPR